MTFRLLSSRIFYQTSKYAPVGVVRLELDIPDRAISELSLTQVNATLAEMSQHGASGLIFLAGPGSPLETYCGLVLELQQYVGHEVAYSRVESQSPDQACRVFIEYEDHATALYAAEMAMDVFNAVLDSPVDSSSSPCSALQQQLDEFVAFALLRRLDPNTRLLKHAARQQDIPAMNMEEPWGMPTWPGAAEDTGVNQYGWGIHQRQCRGAFLLGSLSTQQIQTCLDRALLLPGLKNANLPIARQDLEFTNRNQVRRAQRSAGRIGYPVTIRPKVSALPQYGFPDNGMFGPIDNDEQVASVTNYLREQAKADIWLESFVRGDHYRFLVLGNEVVSVIRFTPPTVVGDGVHTIADLAQAKAEAANDADKYRTWHLLAKGDSAVLCRLKMAGLSLSSIPAPGETVNLRGEGSYYNGGTGAEVLEEVPGCFHTLAVQAATVFGAQQMAGVDLIIDDLNGCAGEPNCAITYVDPVPDLVSHSKLSEAIGQRIPAGFFSLLFPHGEASRIPVVSVTGTNGKTTTSRMIAGILKESGLKVGLSCSDGVYLDGEVVVEGDEAGVIGANEVLMSREIEAAVLETARGGMANMGIAFDHVDVGACLNVAEDHLGNEGIETLDQMAVHKRQVTDRSLQAAVLNAEDARCLAMREHTIAKEVILFAFNPDHPAILTHIESGGCAVVVDIIDDRPTIVLKTSRDIVHRVMAVTDIPATGGGSALHNVHNALAAIGIARGFGISIKHIVCGLEKFKMSVSTTPGRLNEIAGFSFDVLVDAAHNPHGIDFMVQYVSRRKVSGKKVIVFGVRAASSEAVIRECSALLAGNFDVYILRNYRPGDVYGPVEVKVLKIIRQELLKQGVPESRIMVEPGVLEAVDLGIEHSGKGDLLVVQVPAGGNAKWEFINRIKQSDQRTDTGT